MNDQREEGVWEWISGQPVTFTNWKPGEPNNLGDGPSVPEGEDWAHTDVGFGPWNDVDRTDMQSVWRFQGIAEIPVVDPDFQVPVITLLGANPLEIYKGATFVDPGATVTDNVDATRTITGSGTVNTATVGIYTLTYTATDAAGNLAVPVTRTAVS